MNWKSMSTAEKIIFIVSCIGAVIVVLAWMKPNLFSMNLTYPAIALVTLCEAVCYWKKNRKWAYLLIVAAVISLACFILELSL